MHMYIHKNAAAAGATVELTKRFSYSKKKDFSSFRLIVCRKQWPLCPLCILVKMKIKGGILHIY